MFDEMMMRMLLPSPLPGHAGNENGSTERAVKAEASLPPKHDTVGREETVNGTMEPASFLEYAPLHTTVADEGRHLPPGSGADKKKSWSSTGL